MEQKDKLKNIKNIILVSSGKGGVGKSTVASNIAGGLKYLGLSVGMLDADIYGPSQFKLFGITEPDNLGSLNGMEPTVRYGIPVISSAAFVTKENRSMSWKGAMASVVLNTMIFNSNWPELDFLIVDMPPGTGDIQIEICRKLPHAKAIIVTTPQDVALIDCKKGIQQFKDTGIEIMGVVENMSTHICNNCGHVDPIFGEQGSKILEKEFGVCTMAKIPINTYIRINGDAGIPIPLAEAESQYKDIYIALSKAVIERVQLNE